MKICLINPPRTNPPLFTLRDEICFQDVKYVPFPMRLATVAAIARDEGHEVTVIDANAERLSWEELEARMTASDLVITQSAAGILDHDMGVAERVRQRHPETRILMIETVISPIYPERVMAEYPHHDFLIIGQLERVMMDLFAHWGDWARVPGLVWRDADSVRLNPEAGSLSAEELSHLPFMAYDLFPMSRYSVSLLDAPLHERVMPGITLRTARDCPFKCPFCIIGSTPARGYDAKLRAQDAVRAVDEIEYVVKTYGLKALFFWDETFTYNRKRAKALLEEMIRRNLGVVWRCLTRVDCLDDELIDLMARAGCQMIEFGIESGDPEGRKSHHKGFSNEKAIEIVAKVRAAGIFANCDMIIGMPWDSRESVAHTEKLALELKADGLHLTMAFPYPGTEFYKIAQGEGLLQTEDLYDDMIHNRVRVDLKPYVRTRTMSPEEIVEAWSRTRSRINKTYLRRNVLMRPWAFWPVLRHAEGPGHLMRMVPKAFRLLAGGRI